MDPEDAKSLDSNEGVAALAEERSENNSSNSDIVHVEREDAELLAEGEELQESMLSVLGTESDLAALRAEFKEEEEDAIPSHTALIPDAPQALVVLEEPVVLEAPASLSAVPPLLVSADMEPPPEPVPESKPEPPAPVPEPQPEAPSEAPSMASAVESPPPSPIKEATAPPAPEPQPEPASEPVLEPVVVPEPVPIQEPPVAQLEVPEAAAAPILETLVTPPAEALLQAPEPAPAPAPAPAAEPEPEPEPKPESSELPVLLYGGAALVVMAAVAAYGALAYRRK